MAEVSKGYAAPILWGAREGYSVVQIAEGLDIDPTIVVEVIEMFSAVRYPRDVGTQLGRYRAVRGHDIDPTRTDEAYLAWAHAHRGAALLLEGAPP